MGEYPHSIILVQFILLESIIKIKSALLGFIYAYLVLCRSPPGTFIDLFIHFVVACSTGTSKCWGVVVLSLCITFFLFLLSQVAFLSCKLEIMSIRRSINSFIPWNQVTLFVDEFWHLTFCDAEVDGSSTYLVYPCSDQVPAKLLDFGINSEIWKLDIQDYPSTVIYLPWLVVAVIKYLTAHSYGL